MLPFYSFNFVLLIVFAVFFYRVAESEDAPAILWTVLSIAISGLTWQVLHWGLLGMILAQAAFFIGIGVFRAIRKE
jgi:hypothetical protein